MRPRLLIASVLASVLSLTGASAGPAAADWNVLNNPIVGAVDDDAVGLSVVLVAAVAVGVGDAVGVVV